jgi:hypothetical protein
VSGGLQAARGSPPQLFTASPGDARHA